MLKRITLILVVAVVCMFTLSSCAGYKAVRINDEGARKYNNKLYYESEDFCAISWKDEVKEGETLHKLGWLWYMAPLAVTDFYSDEAESPDFIFDSRSAKYSVYFREDYDYKNSELIIDGTDISITISDLFNDEGDIFDSDKYLSIAYIDVHFKEHPIVESGFRILQGDGKYFVQLDGCGYEYDCYELRPEALNTLKDAGLL